MEEASKLFLGHHDFRTFMGKQVGDSERVTRRNIECIKIIRGNIPGYSDYSWPSFLQSNSEEYVPIELYMKGSSFLYKQVSLILFLDF